MGFDTNMEGGFWRAVATYRRWNRRQSICSKESATVRCLGGRTAGGRVAPGQQNLSEITGEFTSDDLLGRISPASVLVSNRAYEAVF